MGADDYVTKPFSPLALIARIRAVTRRYTRSEPSTDWIESKHFKINKKTREVQINDQQLLKLTPKEFDLLCHFVQHPKQVFSREQLLENVWGYDFYGDDRTVDVHIKRLRKKIGQNEHDFFQTVWGVGYKFVEDEEDQADE